MTWTPVATYYDIRHEIDILEIRLEDLERELQLARKTLFGGRMPSAGTTVHVPLDKALQSYDRVVASIRETDALLHDKRLALKRVEDALRGMDGLQHKVSYMRDIQCKTLLQISGELGYSLAHIKRVSSRVPKVRG